MVDSEYAELAMVGSRSEEKAKEVAEQFSCGAWGTYDDIVNNKEINAIYVSLPNSMHEEWSIKALNAGKHVWCEKPAATSFDAAKNMTRAARENGVRLIEGFMFRYHPQHTKIKKIIKEGTLGDPLRFEGCFGYTRQHLLGWQANWLPDRTFSGSSPPKRVPLNAGLWLRYRPRPAGPGADGAGDYESGG